MVKSLYIHIPFCKKFCAYCDFVKCIYQKDKVDEYINLVISHLKKYKNNKFETIYLGGGTPNSLSDEQLDKLLSECNKYLDTKYEFTIECNPEFVTDSQVSIFVKNKINRISLGVQTLDNILLSTMGRKNHKQMVSDAIKKLQSSKIDNISCDLIYGFQNQTNDSIKQDIDYLISLNVKHLSLYSLEIKENTAWGRNNYQTNIDQIENHLMFIQKYLDDLGWNRYEVSNWSINNKYQSKHNINVWKTFDWAAIGYGAHGMENKTLYHYDGSLLDWKLIQQALSDFDLYFQVMIMGLRIKEGLDLTNPLHLKAYEYFKEILDSDNLITKKGNNIICNNVNLLDNILVKLSNYEKE